MISASTPSRFSGAATQPSPLDPPRWLANAPMDLLLLVATPLLIIPLVIGARQFWADETIALFVVVFGANAHHLPGFMRAYGDPGIRDRYRTRLIVAPLAIFALCLSFAFLNLRGLFFVTLLWGVWHGLAQVYGLGRMYDAKVNVASTRTARLDKALCIVWFFGGLLYSPHRMSLVLSELYQCGVPALSAGFIGHLKTTWIVCAVVVTVSWVLNHRQSILASADAGSRRSIKPLLFASSIAFWWYANIPVVHVVLGVALFEVFHDIQYLTTVWIYNHKLVSKNQRLGSFWQFLFRPRAMSVALFVVICWVYGSTGSIGHALLGTNGESRVIAALLLTSLLTHFYFDSFLWNVREQGVREDLDLQGTPETVTQSRFSLSRFPGIAWVPFAAALAVLASVQLTTTTSEVDWRRALAMTIPDNEAALLGFGDALASTGRGEEALRTFERAASSHPDSVAPVRRLVLISAQLGRKDRAQAAFQKLNEMGGEDSVALVSMGILAHQDSPDAAKSFYEQALALDYTNFEAHSNLAGLLVSEGRFREARQHLVSARQISPDHPIVLENLGRVEVQLGNIPAATQAFHALLRVQPNNARVREQVAQLRSMSSDRAMLTN